MKKLALVVVILSFFLMSGVGVESRGSTENVDNVLETDKEVVQVDSVAVEQARIISEMRCQVNELHYMTCRIHRMLKSTGDNDVRRECNPRDYRECQPTSRSGDTHRGGNGYHLTAPTER